MKNEEGLPFLEGSAELWRENNTNNQTERCLMASLFILQMFYTYKSVEMIRLPREGHKCFSASNKNTLLQSVVETPPHSKSPPH